ncbi:regulatory-associated protein of TOR 1 isoform X1 [Dendrobium catenatum]|uniref:Regulatory-associated protein of TOR 1 n=1 Tax=Dendrobium catenatum TaxID=906689 RepID=A0A2I0VP67_9ASPA|nr:regulatory-associated protein of TOR 1 isoform X1 [Dendrobium catenatum]PKU65192.1 Regulatory-associated protein of TOR 1 [Dendrobium catenatum]
MALGDRMAWLFSQSSALVSINFDEFSSHENGGSSRQTRESEAPAEADPGSAATSLAYLPHAVFLREFRHECFEEYAPMKPSQSALVSKWRPKDRMKTSCVALVMCLNIGVDPPDVIKISPCARMECWIDPFSVTGAKVLDRIGKSLHAQYERWQPRARYGLQLDPTIEEVKKLCCSCRKNAKSERVLFHYNGHGVPKPTANGEIWVFNKGYTQYIPLPISELDSWLKTPSMYVFDCSAAGVIVNALIEHQESNSSGASGSSNDCILFAACEAQETLPQSDEFPADLFTSCLTTPIKMALHWFFPRSLLHDSIDHSLIDKIPGRQNDRKTLLGELNWIFTAVTDTIAWDVLPHDLFQRLFRQDLLVACLFRNFLLAERIMKNANCNPISYPLLPPTHQHRMWDAWDMAVEICLSKLPQLVTDPTAEFQPSPFFTEQLTAFEVWLDHGSEHKNPPEQLPIVLQILHSQSFRFRALVLLGRFLDMGHWAVNQALSVGIFPYVLKLLQSKAMELQQILVFIWTKILSLDNGNCSFRDDLVKDGGHNYFIKFLDGMDAYPEQRAMTAFVLAGIVDGYRLGQEACIQENLIHVCLKNLQLASSDEAHTEPLLLQWLCICLGKLWEDFHEAQLIGLQADAPAILSILLLEPQPEVRAAAVFSLGSLIDVGSESFRDGHGDVEDCDADEKSKAELHIVKSLLQVLEDGSPLVRSELVVGLARFGFGHNKQLKPIAGAFKQQGSSISSQIVSELRVGCGSMASARDRMISTRSPTASTEIMHHSPVSDDSSHCSDSGIFVKESTTDGDINQFRSRSLDSVVYSQYLVAMSSLAKDPYTRIAILGRRALAIIGIEHVVSKGAKYNDGSFHQGYLSCQSMSSTIGLTRSSSWFDMHSVKLPVTFRTPPVNSTRQNYLTGLRRVCSLEFGPQLCRPQDTVLADPLLGSIGSVGTSEHSLLPRSSIYDWNHQYFSRPLLNASDENEDDQALREQREKIALDCIANCRHSSITQLNNQIASWDTRFETGAKATLLLPFCPIVVAADENERIRVWNYEDATQLNSFSNHYSSDGGISKLCLVNELDDSLLLVASSEGNIRVWKNYTLKDRQKLVTAFSSIQSHRAGVLASNAVVDWQQQSGYLYASSEISSILIWDLDKEQNISFISSSSDSSISALSASQVRGGQIVAGFVDGSVRIFDVRTPDMPVCATRLHTQRAEKVVGIGFLPELDQFKIVSASQAGDIQFLDIRNHSEAYLTIDAHRGSLTAFAIHRHAPVIASGSSKQIFKVFSLDGDQLSIIKYYPTLMAQRIGSVNCLNFHPYKVLLAAGAADACVSIYADDNYEAR